jgi:hypothetical protein
MLIIPNTTGEPLAGFGVPSPEPDAGAELDVAADVVAPEADVVAAAADVVAADPPELELEPEELPHAATETAATAHAPSTTPLLLSFPFISTSLCRSGLSLPEDVCTHERKRRNCAPPPRLYTSLKSVCK